MLACRIPGAWGHGAIDERIAELTEDLVKSPGDASLHFQLAEANCQHEDWPAALLALARAEELAPGKFPSDLIRGRVALGTGEPADAKKSFDHFLAGHPGNPQVLVLRARALAQLGKDEACLADYRAALAASKNPEPDLFQEAAEALVFRGRDEEAMRVLGDGIAKLGPVPSLVLKALGLELAAGQFDSALLRVDVMRISAPRPEPWMAKRAAILEQAGRSDDARAAWQALAAHLAALPNLQRGSHSMSTLAEQAQQALHRISSATPRSTLP